MLRGLLWFVINFVLTAAIAATAFFLALPLAVILIPTVVLAGIFFAVHGIMVALICVGYVLFFGVVSAWIGYMEWPGYHTSFAFSLSLLTGLVGYALMFLGVWKAWEMIRNKYSREPVEPSN